MRFRSEHVTFVEQRRHDLRRRTVDEARAGEHIEDLLGSASHSARAGVGRGCHARDWTSTTVEARPDTPSAWQAGATPTCAASGWTAQERVPCSRFNPSARQLFPARPGSCARWQLGSRRALAPRARAASHPAGCVGRFAPRFFAPTPAASPCAAPCEPSDAAVQPLAANRRPTSPGCVQRSASSRIRSRYSAVNWRRFGLATTSGSGVGLTRPALGASSLRSSTPRAGTETSFNVIESLSAVIGFHLRRPTEIPKVAGVSVMLAERGAHRPYSR